MNYLDSIISEHIIKSSLYKKEKYKHFYINLASVIICCFSISIWLKQLSIQWLDEKIQYIILAVFFVIALIFIIISANEETKDIDCTFLRKYNKGLSSLKSLIQLKSGQSLKGAKNKSEFILSFFITLIISPFFSNILAGKGLSQIYFFIFLVLIYILCISIINIILLIFNLGTLKYDCFLEMIDIYEIELSIRKNSLSNKIHQLLNFIKDGN